ncbi:MAG: hypothetical protein AVDCRST_MAG25-142, partial [uncultured Rubrobacteraceae bacterium]
HLPRAHHPGVYPRGDDRPDHLLHALVLRVRGRRHPGRQPDQWSYQLGRRKQRGPRALRVPRTEPALPAHVGLHALSGLDLFRRRRGRGHDRARQPVRRGRPEPEEEDQADLGRDNGGARREPAPSRGSRRAPERGDPGRHAVRHTHVPDVLVPVQDPQVRLQRREGADTADHGPRPERREGPDARDHAPPRGRGARGPAGERTGRI